MTRLLFDQNLSPRLTVRLADVFPGARHVSQIGLGRADDRIVWEYARENEYIIVTKDADFYELGLLHGFPPKVVWVRRGNCSTKQIEALLRENLDQILLLPTDKDTGTLALF